MHRSIRAALLASALAVGGLAATAPVMPAAAQYFRADYNGFHDALARDGDWVYSDRWGVVWVPDNVPDDFRPYYTRGHWVYTDDYGWVWSSGYRWGDIAFHYGRWVNDPDDGWMWIPGYVWSPGWVVWRGNGAYTGWMAMPPDDAFLRGDDGPSFSVGFRFGSDNDFFGYGRWYGRDYGEDRYAANWTFVNTRYLGVSDYRSRAVRGPQVINVIRNTANVTNYAVVNDRVVNRSISVQAFVQAGGKAPKPVHVNAVIKTPGLIATVSQGRQVQLQARHDRPRGSGFANSAPTPSRNVIDTLSTRAPRPAGGPPGGPGGFGGRRPPQHLFNRDTIGAAPFRPGAPGAMPLPPGGPQGGPPDGRDRGRFQPGENGAPPPNGGPNDWRNHAGPNGGPPPNGGANDGRNRGGENGPQNGATPPTNNQPPAPPTGGMPNGGEHRGGPNGAPPSPPSNQTPPPNGGAPNGGEHRGGPNGGLPNGGERNHAGPPNGAAPVTPPATTTPLPVAPHAPPPAATPPKPPVTVPTTPVAPKTTPPAAAPMPPRPTPPVTTMPVTPPPPKPVPPTPKPLPPAPPAAGTAPGPSNSAATPPGAGTHEHHQHGGGEGGAPPNGAGSPPPNGTGGPPPQGTDHPHRDHDKDKDKDNTQPPPG